MLPERSDVETCADDIFQVIYFKKPGLPQGYAGFFVSKKVQGD